MSANKATGDNTSFPFLLNEQLARKGWSRSELARRLDANVGYVSRLVSGEVLPGWDAAVRIALLLQVPLSDLAPRQVRPLLAGFSADTSDVQTSTLAPDRAYSHARLTPEEAEILADESLVNLRGWIPLASLPVVTKVHAGRLRKEKIITVGELLRRAKVHPLTQGLFVDRQVRLLLEGVLGHAPATIDALVAICLAADKESARK